MNYQVDRSIVDDAWVVISERDGGVVESAESEQEAQKLADALNAEDHNDA